MCLRQSKCSTCGCWINRSTQKWLIQEVLFITDCAINRFPVGAKAFHKQATNLDNGIGYGQLVVNVSSDQSKLRLTLDASKRCHNLLVDISNLNLTFNFLVIAAHLWKLDFKWIILVVVAFEGYIFRILTEPQRLIEALMRYFKQHSNDFAATFGGHRSHL